MNGTNGSPAGDLELATNEASRKRLQREAKAGRAFRIFPSAYIVGASLHPDECVRLHLMEIVAALWPGGVLCGATALANGRVTSGRVFISTGGMGRTNPLNVGSFELVPVAGPGVLPGDFAHVQGLHLSGHARRLVENMPGVGRPSVQMAGRVAVEEAIDDFARRGQLFITQLRRELDVIAGQFDARSVKTVRDLLDAVLGDLASVSPRSGRLAARLSGQPFDHRVVTLVTDLLATANAHAPVAIAANQSAPSRAWLPFFEAYFSNYIEGTTFTVDEAKRIVVDGMVPADRPADAHDVASTHRLVSGAVASQVPSSASELVELLRDRHAILMAGRPDRHPGDFKRANNQAGGYVFTSWELVEGTLLRGFEEIESVVDPFARALGMTVLLTECHPFDDGNGRISRIMANAELTARGYARIVIPTVYRGNYLAALSALSIGTGKGEQLIAALAFAQRWTAQVDFSTFESADADLRRTNAYSETYAAEAEGLRLTLPNGRTL